MIRTKTKDGGYGFFALRAPWNDQLKIKKKLETNDQKSEWYFWREEGSLRQDEISDSNCK